MGIVVTSSVSEGILFPESSAPSPSCILFRSYELLLWVLFVSVLSNGPVVGGASAESFSVQETVSFILFGVDLSICVSPGQKGLTENEFYSQFCFFRVWLFTPSWTLLEL